MAQTVLKRIFFNVFNGLRRILFLPAKGEILSIEQTFENQFISNLMLLFSALILFISSQIGYFSKQLFIIYDQCYFRVSNFIQLEIIALHFEQMIVDSNEIIKKILFKICDCIQ